MKLQNVALTLFSHDLNEPYKSFNNDNLKKQDFKPYIQKIWKYYLRVIYCNPKVQFFTIQDFKPKRGKYDIVEFE